MYNLYIRFKSNEVKMLNQPVLSFKLFCIYISTTSNVCNMVDTSTLVLTCVAADTEFGMHACPIAKKQLHSQRICKAGDTPGSRDSFFYHSAGAANPFPHLFLLVQHQQMLPQWLHYREAVGEILRCLWMMQR